DLLGMGGGGHQQRRKQRERSQRSGYLQHEIYPQMLERVSDIELEGFDLVAEEAVRLLVFVERDGVAEAQEPHRGQPFDGDTGGFFQLVIVETPIDSVAQPVVELDVA